MNDMTRDPLHVVAPGPITGNDSRHLLVEAFELARSRVPGLRLVRTPGRAPAVLLCRAGDASRRAILEAQASGMPVIAVGADADVPGGLIEDGRSGVICPPEPEAIAATLVALAGSRRMRERLACGGLAAMRARAGGTLRAA